MADAGSGDSCECWMDAGEWVRGFGPLTLVASPRGRCRTDRTRWWSSGCGAVVAYRVLGGRWRRSCGAQITDEVGGAQCRPVEHPTVKRHNVMWTDPLRTLFERLKMRPSSQLPEIRGVTTTAGSRGALAAQRTSIQRTEIKRTGRRCNLRPLTAVRGNEHCIRPLDCDSRRTHALAVGDHHGLPVRIDSSPYPRAREIRARRTLRGVRSRRYVQTDAESARAWNRRRCS